MSRHWLKFAIGILGISLLAYFFIREWERVKPNPPTAWSQDQKADCGVVLTGGPGRVREGFDLLAQGRIKKLIISGVNPTTSLKEIFPLKPVYASVRDEDVILERRSRTTYGNAQQTQPLVEALRCRDLIIITSTTHMYRALKTFRGSFPAGYPILARSIVAGRYFPSQWDVLVETIKSLLYSIFAY